LEVFLDGEQVVEDVLLGADAYLLVGSIFALDLFAVERDAAVVRVNQACQHADRRCLTCTIVTQQTEDLAVVHSEGKVSHSGSAIK
jgi:hypothetical protein